MHRTSPARPPSRSRARATKPSERAMADTRQVLDAIRRVVHALHEGSRLAEASAGVSAAQLYVLEVLESEPALSLGDVAKRTHTHQSSVSVVVTKLEKAGYVLKRPSAVDARRVELAITPAGRALLARAPRTLQTQLVDVLQRMPAARRRELAHGLTALVEEAGLGTHAPAMFFEGRHGVRG